MFDSRSRLARRRGSLGEFFDLRAETWRKPVLILRLRGWPRRVPVVFPSRHLASRVTLAVIAFSGGWNRSEPARIESRCERCLNENQREIVAMKIRNNRRIVGDRIRVAGNKRLRDSRYPILIDEGTIHNPISE